MSSIKAVFIDSEGTLRNPKHKIDELTKNTIKKFVENNIHFVVTTGLPRFITKKICMDANASKYIICSNGADIYNLDSNTSIASDYLNNDIIREIYDLVRHDYNLILGVGDYEYSNTMNGYNINSKIINDDKILSNEKFYQCHISQKTLDFSKDDFGREIYDFFEKNSINELEGLLDSKLLFKLYDNIFDLSNLDRNEIMVIIRAIRFIKLKNLKDYLLCTYDDLSIGNRCIDFDKFHYDTEIPWFTLNKNGVSKGSAILKLCNYLNINPQDVIAIGNDYNDKSMISVCGSFICPNNSLNTIKNHSSLQYDNNDGIGKVLVKMYDRCK